MSFVCHCHALPTLPMLPKSKAATNHFTNKNQTLARAKNVHAGRLLQVFTTLPGFVIDVATFHKLLITSEYIAVFFLYFTQHCLCLAVFYLLVRNLVHRVILLYAPCGVGKRKREREKKKERKKEKTKTTDRAFPYLCLAIGQPSNI